MNPMYGIAAFFALTTVVGCVVMYKGFGQLKLRRIIQNLPTSNTRSIAMGLVELKGSAQKAKKSIEAPFSGKDALYSSWSVEREYHDEDGHDNYRVLASGSEGVPFYLKDETGKVLVDPTGARLEIATRFEANSHFGVDPPERIMAFLKEKGIKFEGVLGMNKTMRYLETRLEPGAKLYVIGNAKSNPDSKGSADHTENIMVGSGADVFLITDKEEKKVVFWAGVSSTVGIIFGACLALGSFFFMSIILLAALTS